MAAKRHITVTTEASRRIVSYEVKGETETIVMQHDFPDAISHHYAPSGLNEDLLLFTGPFQADPAGPTFQGDVRWRWGAIPRIEVRGCRASHETDFDRLLGANNKGMWMTVPELLLDLPEGRLPAQPVRADDSQHQGYSIQDRVEQSLGDDSCLERITFLVPNGWQSMDSTGICDPNDLVVTWHGRTQAQGAGWLVTLDLCRPMANGAAWKELKDSYGQRFTHIGEIRRIDGSAFTGVQAFDVMDRVRLALNLALGRRVTCALPVGYRNGGAVWCRWRSAPVDPFKATASHWLDQTIMAKQIGDIVGLTLDATTDAGFYSALKGAVAYYMAANNDVTVEPSVSLPVSGLQLLAYHHFVARLGAYSKSQWKDLDTEPQIRLLINDADIDSAIPAHLQHLLGARSSLSAAKQSGDALTTIIAMRNVATHPTRDLPYDRFSVYQWAEAGMLAKYWLCLTILKQVGYTGSIASVLGSTPRWTGAIKSAPWSP